VLSFKHKSMVARRFDDFNYIFCKTCADLRLSSSVVMFIPLNSYIIINYKLYLSIKE